MSNSNVAYPSQLVNTTPVSYAVFNSPVANAILKNSAEMSMHDQVSRLQNENQALQRRLQVKSTENNRLHQKIGKVEDELESCKALLSQINTQMINNGQPPLQCKFVLSIIHLNGIISDTSANRMFSYTHTQTQASFLYIPYINLMIKTSVWLQTSPNQFPSGNFRFQLLYVSYTHSHQKCGSSCFVHPVILGHFQCIRLGSLSAFFSPFLVI